MIESEERNKLLAKLDDIEAEIERSTRKEGKMIFIPSVLCERKSECLKQLANLSVQLFLKSVDTQHPSRVKEQQ